MVGGRPKKTLRTLFQGWHTKQEEREEEEKLRRKTGLHGRKCQADRFGNVLAGEEEREREKRERGWWWLHFFFFFLFCPIAGSTMFEKRALPPPHTGCIFYYLLLVKKLFFLFGRGYILIALALTPLQLPPRRSHSLFCFSSIKTSSNFSLHRPDSLYLLTKNTCFQSE